MCHPAVLLANDAVVYCGQHCINFQEVMQAFESLWNEIVFFGKYLRQMCVADKVQALFRRLETTVRLLQTIHGLTFLYDTDGKWHFCNSTRDLSHLLHLCSWSHVSDPRDKIFGALGLLPSGILEPDYTLSVSQVFTQSTFRILERMNGLALLSQANGGHSTDADLLSWVPDWRRPTVLTAPFMIFHELYAAGGEGDNQPSLVRESILRLKGRIVDEIVDIGKAYDHAKCKVSADLPALLEAVICRRQGLAALRVQSRIPNRYALQSVCEVPYLVQSVRAPLYLDADYRNIISHPPLARRAFPTALSGAPLKPWDSFSHCYVLSNTKHASAKPWYPWSHAHFRGSLARYNISCKWPCAMRHFSIDSAESLAWAEKEPELFTRALIR